MNSLPIRMIPDGNAVIAMLWESRIGSRGKKLGDLKAIDPSVSMPTEGSEYVLARLKFQLIGCPRFLRYSN